MKVGFLATCRGATQKYQRHRSAKDHAHHNVSCVRPTRRSSRCAEPSSAGNFVDNQHDDATRDAPRVDCVPRTSFRSTKACCDQARWRHAGTLLTAARPLGLCGRIEVAQFTVPDKRVSRRVRLQHVDRAFRDLPCAAGETTSGISHFSRYS